MKSQTLLFLALVALTACSQQSSWEEAPAPLTREQLRRLAEFDNALGSMTSSASSLAVDLAKDNGNLPTNVGELKPGADYTQLLQQYRKTGLCRGVDTKDIKEPAKTEAGERIMKGSREAKYFKSISGDDCQIKLTSTTSESSKWDETSSLLEDFSATTESSISWGMTPAERKLFADVRAIEAISLSQNQFTSKRKEIVGGDIITKRTGNAAVSGSITYESQRVAISGSGAVTSLFSEVDQLTVAERTAHLEVKFPDFRAVIDLSQKTDQNGSSTAEVLINGRVMTMSLRNLMGAAGF